MGTEDSKERLNECSADSFTTLDEPSSTGANSRPLLEECSSLCSRGFDKEDLLFRPLLYGCRKPCCNFSGEVHRRTEDLSYNTYQTSCEMVSATALFPCKPHVDVSGVAPHRGRRSQRKTLSFPRGHLPSYGLSNSEDDNTCKFCKEIFCDGCWGCLGVSDQSEGYAPFRSEDDDEGYFSDDMDTLF
ncbi:uncharacterized protein PHA67_006406 isoform 2-T3 [Liasis olivaceus]